MIFEICLNKEIKGNFFKISQRIDFSLLLLSIINNLFPSDHNRIPVKGINEEKIVNNVQGSGYELEKPVKGINEEKIELSQMERSGYHKKTAIKIEDIRSSDIKAGIRTEEVKCHKCIQKSQISTHYEKPTERKIKPSRMPARSNNIDVGMEKQISRDIFKTEIASNSHTNTITDHINKKELINQISEKIKFYVNGDSKEELVIKLKPEFLGRLKIRLVSENDHIKIEFITDNHIAKDAINSHLPVLQKILVQQGLPVQEISVFINWQGYHDRRAPEYRLKTSYSNPENSGFISPASSHRKIKEVEDAGYLDYWA